MAVSFEAFLWSLTQQESGGNYGAVGQWVNGDRAYGRYQVMGANIPSWTKKYYGTSLTPQQYLSNPAAQDAVVRGVLKGYYDKYGPEGAAAMWYSGQSNPSKTYGNPPVYKYVQQVMSRAASNPNATLGGGGGGGSSSGGGGKTPTIDKEVLASQYGFVQGLFDAIPELKNLFNQAVAGSWSSEMFQAKLRNTTWWKTHSDKEREWLTKKVADPATANDEWLGAWHKLQDMATQLGVPVMSDSDKSALVYNMLALGWNDSQIKFQLGNLLKFAPEGGLAGAGGDFQMKMSSIAWANGVQLDQDWYRIYYQGILRGTTTEQQAQQDIRNRAAALFPGFTDQIMAGVNVSDLASPYLQGMSSILEINPADIDLFDPTIKSALNYKDKDGVLGAKPLWQFEVDMRKDPRWVKTNNAREGLMGVAHKVAQDLGVLF